MSVSKVLFIALLIFSHAESIKAQTTGVGTTVSTTSTTSGTTAGSTSGSTEGGTSSSNVGSTTGTTGNIQNGTSRQGNIALTVPLENLPIGNSFVSAIISLSPILLHLLLLIWVWASKLSVREVLADKETVRQQNAAELRLQEEKMRSLFPRSVLTLGPVLPEKETLQAMIQADSELRMKFLDYTATESTRTALLTDQNNPVNPPRVGSVSRLVVFMAGHAGVAIGTCLASFVIFFRLNSNGDTPELTGLIGVILALGIGVVPYAVNRFTSDKEEAPPQQSR